MASKAKIAARKYRVLRRFEEMLTRSSAAFGFTPVQKQRRRVRDTEMKQLLQLEYLLEQFTVLVNAANSRLVEARGLGEVAPLIAWEADEAAESGESAEAEIEPESEALAEEVAPQMEVKPEKEIQKRRRRRSN